VESASNAYTMATNVVRGGSLPATNPVRLGLALNYSVFAYEISGKPSLAITIAKKAFDEAVEELDGLDNATYKDATMIMQLLRDNINLWVTEQGDETST